MRPKRPEALEAASAMSTMLTPDRLRVLLQLIVGQVRLQSDDCTDTRTVCVLEALSDSVQLLALTADDIVSWDDDPEGLVLCTGSITLLHHSSKPVTSRIQATTQHTNESAQL